MTNVGDMTEYHYTIEQRDPVYIVSVFDCAMNVIALGGFDSEIEAQDWALEHIAAREKKQDNAVAVDH